MSLFAFSSVITSYSIHYTKLYELAELGDLYDFYVMDADLAKATQTVQFAKKFPKRFINIGIAEANMMGYAAGIS